MQLFERIGINLSAFFFLRQSRKIFSGVDVVRKMPSVFIRPVVSFEVSSGEDASVYGIQIIKTPGRQGIYCLLQLFD